jgi:hypothetical protein
VCQEVEPGCCARLASEEVEDEHVADEQGEPKTEQKTEQGEQKTLVDILIRIELRNGPDDTVYEALQEGMLARQWLTTLTTMAGDVFPLPFATYSGVSEDSLEEIADQIHDWVVDEVWAEGALVLVTELTGWFLAGDM